MRLESPASPRLGRLWIGVLLALGLALSSPPAAAVEAALAAAEASLRDGAYEDALSAFDAILADSGLGDRDRAVATGGAGLAHASLGQITLGQQRLRESVRLADAADAPEVAAASAYNLALTFLEPNRRPVRVVDQPFGPTRSNRTFTPGGVSIALLLRAANQFADAGAVALRGPNETEASTLAARAFASAVTTRVRTGRPRARAQAVEDLGAASGALERAAPGSERLRAALAVGDAGLALVEALERADPARNPVVRMTFEALDAALTDAGALDDARLEGYARGALGRLYAAVDRLDEAASLTEQAIALAEQTDAFETLFRWQGQLGGIRARQDRVDDALLAYRNAAETIQFVRPVLAAAAGQIGQISSREQVEPILLDYADLLLRSGSPEQILAARTVVDQLKTIELEQFFEEMCVAGDYGAGATVDAVDPATAILYPVVFEDRVDLILSAGGTVSRRSVEVSRSELAALVRRTLGELTIADRSDGPLRELGRLYDIFVRPIEGALEANEISTIVFAPDGVLRGAPLAAFHDGERFVIERYAVGTALTLSLVDPRPLTLGRPRAVLAGVTEALEVPRGARSERFSELSAVQAELSAIAGILPGEALLNDAFTKRNFSQALEETGSTIVHIASHATFGDTADDSYLLAHGGVAGVGAAIGLDELSRFADRARVRGEPIELLTLSACDTGVGRSNAEDDNAILGLAGVAFRAGARSVLASLWPVFDVSTSRLMPRFYDELLNGDPPPNASVVSKAEALRRAQLATLQTEETRHPAFWAAFVLVGNWL